MIEPENRLITEYVFVFVFSFFSFLTRSGVIRIVVRRSARQPAEQHYGSNTQQSHARFAFDEHQCGCRVFKGQQPFGCLFGYLPLGMSSPDPLGSFILGVATSH